MSNKDYSTKYPGVGIEIEVQPVSSACLSGFTKLHMWKRGGYMDDITRTFLSELDDNDVERALNKMYDVLMSNPHSIVDYTFDVNYATSCFTNIAIPIPKCKIRKVIFNDPATIVYWSDGTKTVVKCQKDDKYDKMTGLAMCISKKMLGNKGNYYEVFKKYIGEDKDEENSFGSLTFNDIINGLDDIRRNLNKSLDNAKISFKKQGKREDDL